jgi:hypothetical protein
MFTEWKAPGEGPDFALCASCKQPIAEEWVEVRFDHDPHGHEGLTGKYHVACATPFAAIARAMNMLSRPWGF